MQTAFLPKTAKDLIPSNAYTQVSQYWNKVGLASQVKPTKGGMDTMLENLNLPLVGRHHSGIDDTRNIA